MTKGTQVAAPSMASITVSSVTSAMTSSRSGRPGRLAQAETGRFGSASMMVTAAPLRASSQARTTAEVDLPAPPLGLAKTMVGIGIAPPAIEVGKLSEIYQICNGYL